MIKTIQIGNLGYSMDNRDLTRLFAPHGTVRTAMVYIGRNSGQSTGLGIVEMESDTEGEAAIAALNGSMHCGRALSVCWSDQSAMPDANYTEMFGPMNMVDEVVPPVADPERRGLP